MNNQSDSTEPIFDLTAIEEEESELDDECYTLVLMEKTKEPEERCVSFKGINEIFKSFWCVIIGLLHFSSETQSSDTASSDSDSCKIKIRTLRFGTNIETCSFVISMISLNIEIRKRELLKFLLIPSSYEEFISKWELFCNTCSHFQIETLIQEAEELAIVNCNVENFQDPAYRNILKFIFTRIEEGILYETLFMILGYRLNWMILSTIKDHKTVFEYMCTASNRSFKNFPLNIDELVDYSNTVFPAFMSKEDFSRLNPLEKNQLAVISFGELRQFVIAYKKFYDIINGPVGVKQTPGQLFNKLILRDFKQSNRRLEKEVVFKSKISAEQCMYSMYTPSRYVTLLWATFSTGSSSTPGNYENCGNPTVFDFVHAKSDETKKRIEKWGF